MNDNDTFTTRLWHTSKFVYMFVSHFSNLFSSYPFQKYGHYIYWKDWDSRESIDIFWKKLKTKLRPMNDHGLVLKGVEMPITMKMIDWVVSPNWIMNFVPLMTSDRWAMHITSDPGLNKNSFSFIYQFA